MRTYYLNFRKIAWTCNNNNGAATRKRTSCSIRAGKDVFIFHGISIAQMLLSIPTALCKKKLIQGTQ